MFGVKGASCRALLDGLRLDVALVKSTGARVGDRVILAAGWLLIVESRVLKAALWRVKLLMARLSAGPRGL